MPHATVILVALTVSTFALRVGNLKGLVAIGYSELERFTRAACDGSAYAGSMTAQYARHAFTLGYEVPGFLCRAAGVGPWVFGYGRYFLIYLVGVFAVFFLARSLLGDDRSSLVAVGLLIGSSLEGQGFGHLSLGGTHDSYDAVGLAMSILAVAFLVRGRAAAAFVVAGFAFNVAPGFALITVTIMLVAARRPSDLPRWLLAFAAAAAPLLTVWLSGALEPWRRLTDAEVTLWWRLMDLRKGWALPSSWPLGEWVANLSLMIAGGIAWREATTAGGDAGQSRRHHVALKIAVAAVAVASVGIVTTYLRLSPALAAMRLERALTLSVVLSGIYIARWAMVRLEHGAPLRLAAGLFVVLALILHPAQTVIIAVLLAMALDRTLAPRRWRLYALAFAVLAAAWVAREVVLPSSGAARLAFLLPLAPYVGLIAVVAYRQRSGLHVGAPLRPAVANILVGAILVLSIGHIAVEPRFRPPWPKVRSWIDAQEWAVKNTPRSAGFVNEPQWPFDSLSGRRHVISWTELGSALWTPRLLHEELGRVRDLGLDVEGTSARGGMAEQALKANFLNKGDAEFRRLAVKYDAQYAIVNAGHTLGSPRVFANQHFWIYALTP